VSHGKYFNKTALACLILASPCALAQEPNNPFEFQDRQQAQVVEQVVQADTTELSAPQREQVIALLTAFLSDAGVNSEDSLFKIGNGKKFLVIPDEDKFIGKISGRYIVWDESRKKNIYHNASDVDDILNATEYAAVTSSQGAAIDKVGKKLLNDTKEVVESVFEMTPVQPTGIQLGRQAKETK